MAQQFFYDNNIRKWMLQIIRMFSEFTVQYGLDAAGNQMYTTVPVIYGDSTFSAATVLRLNSENVMPSTPLISIYVSALKFDRQRTQAPTFEDTFAYRTRQWDANVGAFLPQQGNAYNIKRFMPVPYDLQVKIDIVTSNTQQKLQILEQILPLFNPALELQKVDNWLDWESLAYLEMEDVNWSNRPIPVAQGSDSSYDVCTLTMHAPIWMSLPAQVSKMGVIFKVIMNIEGMDDMNDILFSTRQVVTYNNYGLYVTPDNVIQVLPQMNTANGTPTDVPDAFWNAVTSNSEQALSNGNASVTPYPLLYGTPLDWTSLLGVYGKYRPGVSMIGLSYDQSPSEILGTITVNPVDNTKVIFTPNVATLPSNTLPSINAIVNPLTVSPGNGLPAAAAGQSYLITENIGSAWPYDTVNSGASANINDIITYSNNAWVTTFSAEENTGNVQFVFDQNANVQIQWNGNAWVQGWYGPYDAASWRMIL